MRPVSPLEGNLVATCIYVPPDLMMMMKDVMLGSSGDQRHADHIPAFQHENTAPSACRTSEFAPCNTRNGHL